MFSSYVSLWEVKRFVCKLPLFLSLLLSFHQASAQTKDSTITAVYTDFKTYWSSSIASNSTILPDTSHNLLAFTFRGKTYSTGVNNAILNTKLGSSNYSAQVFKALPVSNIAGTVLAGGSTYIATAIKNDGDSTKAAYKSPYPTIRIADVLTDGKNGLDLGTGVTNLPAGARMSFPIQSLNVKASTDSVPDLIFTQIATPTSNSADTIFFFDVNGSVVGNKKLVYWNTVNILGTYKLDLYNLATGVSCNTSSINNVFGSNTTRPISMVAFLLTEFGITNSDSTAKVKGIMIAPNGTSDQAFIAYNTSILNLDVPTITTQPASQRFCDNSTTSATFSVAASSGTTMSYQWKKNGAAISGATSSSYNPTGLTLADTVNAYSVTITNSVGSVTSDNAYITYTIVTQPVNQYVATGTPATFTVRASGATGYQWYKGGVAISGATSASYTVAATTLAMSGNTFYVVVSYSGGTCTSSTASLSIENLPAITTQPLPQVLCSSSTTSATFSVAGTSTSALAYQWYKNGIIVPGATSATYQPSGLTFSDTANTYYATLINGVGFTTSSTVGLKYLILTHPSPSSAYLATGNVLTFAATASNMATAFQWKKDGVAISGATASSYNIGTVTTASAGNYTLAVSYAGGSCLTNAGVLTTSTVLYSKGTGNINSAANWGVATDGSGSTPVDFTRSEHTFIVANRATAATGTNLIIAGTFDVGNGTTTITGGTTLEAGRFIRSLITGTLAGTATSGLLVHGKSDLYFDASNKTMQTLTINSTDTVALHTALDMTAGSGHGIVKVTSGVFNTGDLLTLKSDSNGTASVGNLAGTIIGKVTVERYIPAHRAWRLFCSPVAAAGAPTIHDAWQEGASNSTDNPHPGFGTHITYGAESDGFDQNPQHSFSLKVRTASSTWIGAPATNTTLVTDYPAYFIFIRGNRSYDITSTTNTITPLSTVLRTTGNLNQGVQSNVPVANGGFALAANPYASPVDFESIYSHSQNISHRIRIWNPNLGGTKGTGAFVTVYWNGSGYSTTPTISTGDNCRFLQANEGFYIEGAGSGAYASFRESDKDTTSVLMPFGRLTEAQAQSTLAINLKVFNADNTTSITDGVAYLFGNVFNSSVDGDDIEKINNFSENLGIVSHNNILTVEERSEPAASDSLQLNLSGTGSRNYQFEFIPRNTGNNLYLWDRYLQTETAIGSSDTNRISVTINTSIAASKATDRFVIVSKNIAPIQTQFTNITATAKQQTAEIQWSVTNTSGIFYFDVERSANGTSFSQVGSVKVNDNKSYSFIDNLPLQGTNYYRVKSVKSNAAASYTSTVNVVFGSSNESHIAVYPNPLTTNHCVLNMHNKPEGKYEVKLVNQAGIVVFTTSVTASGTDYTIPLVLPSSLAKGIYQLQAESGGKKDIITLVSMY